MYRVTIIYRAEPGATFDWEYYMTRHLPLAVGTSRRHCGLIRCDVDKPIEFPDQGFSNPHVCICVVYFDSEKSMTGFREIFATGHPDSEVIAADEPNYTNITPLFVAGDYSRHQYHDNTVSTMVRIRFMWPGYDTAEIDKNEVDRVITSFSKTELSVGQLDASEVDICNSDVGQGSRPAYALLWSLYLKTRNADTLNIVNKLKMQKSIEQLNEATSSRPEIMISDVMEFNLRDSDRYLTQEAG